MMSDNAFDQLTDEIMTLGYDEDTAAHFARLIGDTPVLDQDDNVVVEENGKVLATLPLRFFKQ
jgi:enhancing lycopene biosynthesis protein 2